jgi:hypothetical protein
VRRDPVEITTERAPQALHLCRQRAVEQEGDK